MPCLGSIRLLIFVKSLMRMVAFNPQPSILGHLDECFRWGQKDGRLAVHEDGATLLTY
ncbi:MAG: hypothetical protein WBZ01_14080 [Terriglobales bacterium]